MQTPPYRLIPALAALLMIAACAGIPLERESRPTESDIRDFIASAGLTDARGRFREVFCAVLEEHGPELPDYRPCEEALTLVAP